MPHEYLSGEQVSRYGRFVADPAPEELEKFFFLDEAALAEARVKRRLHNRMGWSIQWGTVRMLGTFLTDSGPVDVPEVVIRHVAEQLGTEDQVAVKRYGDRPQTPYDHAAEIRELLGYREFAAAEPEVAAFITSRVRKTRDSRRELFDRSVLWLIENRVLLPGISTLSRLVTEVRRGELAAINQALAGAAPPHMRGELVATLMVPDGKKVSVLEWMRTAVTKVSGTGMAAALDRSAYVLGLGTGAVDCSAVAPVKLAELARFGMTAKAFQIAQLEDGRRAATLLATVRQLEGASVDDALLLFDLLMSTVLLSRASRAADKEKLKSLPRLRLAAARLAAAWAIVAGTPQTQAGTDGGEKDTTAAELVGLVEQVVTREQLAAALETVAELLPLAAAGDDGDDGDLEWRVELAGRYGTVKPFAEQLAAVIPWGATAAGAPMVAALKALPRLLAARKPGLEHITEFGGAGDRVVAAAGVRQPEAGAAADRPARLCVLHPGGLARGAAAAGCVRGRRRQVGQPASPPDRGAAVGA